MNIDASNAHCGPRILFPDHVWLRVVSVLNDCSDPDSRHPTAVACRRRRVSSRRRHAGLESGGVAGANVGVRVAVVGQQPRAAAGERARVSWKHAGRESGPRAKAPRASAPGHQCGRSRLPWPSSCPRLHPPLAADALRRLARPAGAQAAASGETRSRALPEAPFAKRNFQNTRPQSRRDYPLNLSILLSGGKETNQDSPSSGERTGKSPAPNPAVVTGRREMWRLGGSASPEVSRRVQVLLERGHLPREGARPVETVADSGRTSPQSRVA